MLTRAKVLLNWILGEAAALPLRVLARQQRGEIIEAMAGAMVSDVHAGDHRLRFATPTPLLQGRADAALLKEPDTIRWIEGFEAGDVFWDVGANVGTFSIFAAALRGTRVLAFEPSAGNYAVLCGNIELNSLAQKITPYCIAFSGTTRLGVLNSESRIVGAALHQFGEPGQSSRYWPNAKGVCVQGMIGFGIDDFIKRFAPPFPGHLKLDVDGSELDILRGASVALSDKRLRSVMVELPVSDADERTSALALMADAGFELSAKGELQRSAGAAAANHFFTRRR